MKPEKVAVKQKLIEMGLTDEELSKPLVVIIYEDGCFGSVDDVKLGILQGGCAPITLCVPSFCAAAAGGKELLLASRETAADFAETLLSLYCADGAVLIAESESCMAGLILGTVRKNVPFVVLPKLINSKYCHKTALTQAAEVLTGAISLSEYEESCFGTGRGGGLDNVNSLCLFLEGCGISIMDGMSAETKNEKIVLARSAGVLAAQRALKLSYPRKDLNLGSFTNGLAAHISAGGTVCSLLHIIAIGRENGLDIDFDFVASLSQRALSLPLLSPLGDADIFTFKRAGGIRALLKSLAKTPKLISLDTHYGDKPLKDILAGENNSFDLVKDWEICTLKGNVAKTGLVRRRECDKIFKGKAIVFDNEDLARGAILSGGVHDDCALIIKCQSAADNGMPLLDIESALHAAHIKNAVIITDGRTIELGYYTTISLLDKTDVFDALASGDTVEIDFKKGKIAVDVGAKEVAARLKKNVLRPIKTGLLLRYTNLVGEANHGCALKNRF